MTSTATPERRVICHGTMILDNGDHTHADGASNPDLWSVYLRTETPEDPQQPFDITEEKDFKYVSDAHSYAVDLCQKYRLRDDFEEE